MELRPEDDTRWLTVYDISGDGGGTFTLLDSVELGNASIGCRPRVDGKHRVYLPCRRAGVRRFRWEGDRLSAMDPLACVENARSPAVNTEDAVYVSDYSASSSVCLVSVSTDTAIKQLGRPEQAGNATPYHVSVLGDTILICYGSNILVTYHSESPSAGEVLQTPEGLEWVFSITTDGYSSFLVTDYDSGVYVLDTAGNLSHRIQPDTDNGYLQECAVVQSQLWLGYRWGATAVMSSQ